MFKFLKKFERIIIIALICMMAIVLSLSILELGWTITKDIIDNFGGFGGPLKFIEIDNLLAIFGLFLLVLIGIELLGSIKVYLVEDVVHVEVILLVAIIAISRKAIVLDLEKVSGITIISLGVVIIALAVGYFIIKKVQKD